MSLTLGEKLRRAREERGISISEVAEQTRISPIYIESIENDDYKLLPGGIFNKGFVKSYAKFIGFDEQEALNDYARLSAQNEIVAEHPQKVYQPEVLTDDRATASMLPTILFAGVILALMTGGILFVLNYLQSSDSPPVANANTNTNAVAANSNVGTPADTTPAGVPTMADLRVEFSAVTEPISLRSTADGNDESQLVSPGSPIVFQPKQSLRLGYSRSLAQSARLSMNGKPITLPETPLNPRRNVIEFEITGANLAKIWNEGKITFDVPVTPSADTNVNANSASPTATPTRPPETPAPRPTATPVPANKPPANRPPANTPARPTPRSSPN